ncbi:trehalase isoform X1 [Bactrocera dorsalis]|uniref:Trehalase n=2 Tax=Endopterygota TaxID=33392 RepID=J9Q3L8_BACDO|nr:trehalase [Bactrocera dorsalis]XP_011206588.1 trehalase isoform X1 [Bactrocera dorsalis]XP_011206589.1 trehalase isoform X1 [Bactrocera dorsalis]XP_029407015.1 trehalase isoform X1 [Bactrocera dorsalis]AFI80736.1 trehalase [Bactrocera dorsalis]
MFALKSVVSTRFMSLGALVILNLCVRVSFGHTIPSNAIQKRLYEAVGPETCQIYCHGPLLHTVQMAQLYQDSKTFVDMKLKNRPEKTMEEFNAFMLKYNDTPTEAEIRDFVDTHFEERGKEFETWVPNDWKENPEFLNAINDPDLKQWGSDLNGIWKELGRKMIEDVHKNPEYYSIIPVDNPVIVPGGRFIEFYYWDSYWIIRGLLYSEMYDTARGMIENFLSIVQRFGYIPNGGRVYYSGRSQPPFLTAMVKAYVDFKKDYSFALEALDTLEHEFEYWMNNHTVQAKGYDVAIYTDASTGPRPESYREDIKTSEDFRTDEDKEQIYTELKAGAESGMDFSSRWFVDENGTNDGGLKNLKTRSIVPVDLNALLYMNAKIIAEFHDKAGNTAKSAEYEAKAARILEAIQAVHWNEEAGVWLDYDMINQKPRNYFVPTNLSPLYTGAFNKSDSERISASVLKYIDDLKLDSYPGGVPNTLAHTGEQWDFPNVWPPMQYILIRGLENLGTPEAKKLSERWGHRWVKSNFEAYKQTQTMFEKYDALRFGGHGGGGEYDVQKGFGWSNGVIIEFLTKYGGDLSLSNSAVSTVSKNTVFSLTVALLISVFGTMLGRSLW